MNNDITFCFNTKCKNTKCKRNPKNILIPYQDHSFAFFKECKYWDAPETFYIAQKQEEPPKERK